MHTSPYSHRKALLQVACAGVLWGMAGVAMQLLREQDPIAPLAVIAWRALIGAGLGLLLLVALGRIGELVAFVRRYPRQVVAVGLGTTSFQTLFFLAVPMAGVAVATMVGLGLAPVLLTVYDAYRSRQAPGLGRVTVLATALTGLVLLSVVAGKAGTGPRPFLGLLLAAASATILAITTVVVGGRISQVVSPLVFTNAMAVVGALVLPPTILLVDGRATTRDPAAWAWLLFLGVFTIVVAWVLLYSALRVLTASTAVTVLLVEPVTAALAAAAVLQEPLGFLGATGIVMVLVGVAGIGRPAVNVGPVADPADPEVV